MYFLNNIEFLKWNEKTEEKNFGSQFLLVGFGFKSMRCNSCTEYVLKYNLFALDFKNFWKFYEIYLFTYPDAQAGYDTRLISRWSLTGLNSEFSFTKSSLPIAGGRIVGFIRIPWVLALWKMQITSSVFERWSTYLYIYIYVCVCVYQQPYTSRVRHKINFHRSLTGLNSEFFSPGPVAAPKLKSLVCPTIYP